MKKLECMSMCYTVGYDSVDDDGILCIHNIHIIKKY